MARAKRDIKSLFYITHINNVKSILQYGILSHALVEERKIPFTPIYDADIVSNRRERLTPDGKSLWNFANLYFQPKNPMLYRVINEKDKRDIAIIGIEDGLKWVRDNYSSEGINSLAVPALGCGLGGLDWRDVGPLMCKYLSELDIPVAIYLPREQEISKEFLSGNFLLNRPNE